MSLLHHFYWRGKERSVSISKNADKLHLLFIDPEITTIVGSHVSAHIDQDGSVAHEGMVKDNMNLAYEILLEVIQLLKGQPHQFDAAL